MCPPAAELVKALSLSHPFSMHRFTSSICPANAAPLQYVSASFTTTPQFPTAVTKTEDCSFNNLSSSAELPSYPARKAAFRSGSFMAPSSSSNKTKLSLPESVQATKEQGIANKAARSIMRFMCVNGVNFLCSIFILGAFQAGYLLIMSSNAAVLSVPAPALCCGCSKNDGIELGGL